MFRFAGYCFAALFASRPARRTMLVITGGIYTLFFTFATTDAWLGFATWLRG